MKTKIITFMAIMMIIMTSMSFTNKVTKETIIRIQPIDTRITSTELSTSAGIISARLKDFNIENFKVTVIPEKKLILLAGINHKDISIVEKLLLNKGRIEFFRAFNHTELSELLKDNTQLYSMLDTTDIKKQDNRIGCMSLSKIDKVTEYLSSTGLTNKCRFAWSDFSDSNRICLYALKKEHVQESLLTGSDLDSASFKQDKIKGYWYTEFRFKKPVIKVWADITRQNIGNAIAIVIDNQVICTPVVRSVIEGGKCNITGNFTGSDVKLFAAFANHGELPTGFRVIK
jgi:preprotein translocase subunit SecD